MSRKRILTALGRTDSFGRQLYEEKGTGFFYCDTNLLPPYDKNASIYFKGEKKHIEDEPVCEVNYIFAPEEELKRKRPRKRGFEVVSSCRDAELPRRGTSKSAGYDFFSYEEGIIFAGEKKLFKTGIKVYMESDEVLLCLPRSSLGIKHGIRLTNGTGVIDSDYYNNPQNEGEIHVSLHNIGKGPFLVRKGDKIFQAIFTKYLTIDDDDTKEKRLGGIGSTGK